MARYSLPALLAWVLLGLSWFTGIFAPNPLGLSTIAFGPMCWIAGVWTALWAWGAIGIAISKRQDVFKREPMKLYPKSWHYRFNKWISDFDWKPPKSECQYWSFTASNFLSIGPMEGIVTAVVAMGFALYRPIGWFLGYKPNGGFWEPFETEFSNEKGYHRPRQKAGPVIGVILLGLVTTAGFGMFHEWIIQFVVDHQVEFTLASIVCVMVLPIFHKPTARAVIKTGSFVIRLPFVVVRTAFSPFRGVAAFFVMRVAGVCRPVQLID